MTKWMVGFGLIAAALLTGCKREVVQSAKAAASPVVNAIATRVEQREFTTAISVTGSLVSKARVDVKAETTGRVLRFSKMEGDAVSAGEAVVWVEPENYKLATRQADSSVQVADAALARTRVLREHAASELDRAKNLLGSGGITDKDYKLAQVTEQESRTQVSLAEAQLAQARAALDVARKRERDTVVRAPVAGEIQHKFINEGAYVEPPTPVFTLVDNGRLELESPVSTVDLGVVKAGQKVTFAVNSYPGERFLGTVVEIAPAVETQSRAAMVRIAVSNSGRRLKAGMFAEGEIQTGVVQQAIVIPASALYRDDRSMKDSFVYTVENGVAKKRAVKIGRERGSEVQIASGLSPGQLVLTEQSIEIAEGVKIAAKEGVGVSQ